MSCTASEILALLHCNWLHVTLRSPIVSIRLLKLQAMCIFRFMCKHRSYTWYISRRVAVRKASDSKSDLKGHSRSLVLVFYIFCTVSEILSVMSQNLKRSRDPERIPYHACARRLYVDVNVCTPHLKCLVLPIPKIWLRSQNLKLHHVALTAPLLGLICHPKAKPVYKIWRLYSLSRSRDIPLRCDL